MVRVFFRDDDVGELTEQLQWLVDLFLDRRLPVSYQVVPMLLSRETASYMKARQASTPRLIRMNQHGLKHSQLIKGKHYWSEFAGHRPYADQLTDIQLGKRILEDSLGDSFDSSLFTPPQH